MTQRSKLIFKLAAWLCIIFFFMACKEEAGCGSANNSTLTIQFFKKSDVSADSLLRFDSIYAIGSDSVLYDSADNLSTFDLPVHPFSHTTQFVLNSTVVEEDTIYHITDSISVSYSSSQRVISPDCGAEQFYENLDVLSHSFDSLVINNDVLNNEANISIYP